MTEYSDTCYSWILQIYIILL